MILFIFIILVGLGVLLLFLLKRQETQFGSLMQERVYQDTEWKPGDILTARTLPIRGKPDYLIRDNEVLIPVEVKTGRTPTSPYLSHIMQLMTYCYLVEDIYGVRPPGGIIKYPEKEFKVGYTDAAKESLKKLVTEILEAREKKQAFQCPHPQHNG